MHQSHRFMLLRAQNHETGLDELDLEPLIMLRLLDLDSETTLAKTPGFVILDKIDRNSNNLDP